MNNKQEIEKSLKRYLKKKISYTFSLLIAFLITGGFAAASELNQEVLLSRIKEDREKLESMLQENYKKEAALQKDNLDILKEADFYVKPKYGALFSMPYFSKKSKRVDKEWQGSVRSTTEYDAMRNKFNTLQSGGSDLSEAGKYTTTANKYSSGWVNKNTNYGKTANAYDVEAKLFILPVVKAPVVKSPTAPAVSFTTPVAPTELKIDAPTEINISMGAINVNAPAITAPTVSAPATITAPTVATVTVNEPNVAINIGSINVTGPAGLTLPTLQAPTVNVTLNPQVPPHITPPNPQITPPVAPAAPNFTIYTPGGGWWLSGWAGTRGINTFDRDILAATNAAQASPKDKDGNVVPLGLNATKENLRTGALRRQTDTVFPLFADMTITKGSQPGRGKIYAYRKTGEAKTGYKNISSTSTFSEYEPYYYPTSNTGLTPAQLKIVGSNKRVAYTGGVIPDREIVGQMNRWVNVNYGVNTIDNIDFELGGKNGIPTEDSGKDPSEANKVGEDGVILTRNDGKLTIQNSKITLNGNAAIVKDILYGTGYPTGLTLNSIEYEFKGNNNTLYMYESYSDNGHPWSTPEVNSKEPAFGKPYDDSSVGKEGVHGRTDINMDTRGNVALVLVETYSYRWNGFNAITNPQALMVYNPTMNRFRFENEDGTGKGKFFFNGAGNIGAWLKKYVPDRTKYAWNSSMPAAEKPMLNLGEVYMNGDSNVGIYLQGHKTHPNFNAVYMGDLPIDFKIGVSLNGLIGTQQLTNPNTGGNTDGDDKHTSGNVALYVASGQREELTVANGYFPATTDLKAYSTTNTYGVGIGTAGGTQIAYPGLQAPAHAIQNLKITDYKIDFGQYSKNNIAVVARNGSVVELEPSSTTITDGQNSSTLDANRADGTILAFAEGVWWNPRPAVIKPNDATVASSGQTVTDGRAGQKYVPQYGSSVRTTKNIEMGSKNAVAGFAKDGAYISTGGIKIYGAGSTAAFALSKIKYGTTSGYTSIEKDKNYGGLDGKLGFDRAPSKIAVNGDIVLENGDANKGAIAINDNGDGAEVNVTGKLVVKGLGAYAKGENASITIGGAGSTLTSGNDGSLVALDKGVINFNGGTINHSIADQLPFYSANDSKLTFDGTTTVNISKGIVFYGNASDFSAGAGNALYNKMNNVTIELKDNGVNLGVFKDIDAIWDGTSNYLNDTTNGLKNIPKVNAIHDNGYWYKSALEGKKITVKTDVDRDKISSGPTPGDGFNDITMERKQVIVENSSKITSTKGNLMALGSNTTGLSNAESGYTVNDGIINISDTTHPNDSIAATYVNFGHIITGSNGTIEVGKGVAAYGVNGSKIINEGTLKVDSSDSINKGIGIAGFAKSVSGTETYGINDSTIRSKMVPNSKWIEIENKGNIDITGTDGIAIYAKNNVGNIVTKNLSTIYNKAPITLGDNGKAIVFQTDYDQGGTITLEDSGTNQDIKVGQNGIGVYAENSDINLLSDYGIAIKDSGVALQTKGVTNINGAGKTLNVEYTGSAGATAMAMGFIGTAATHTFNNDINISINNTGNAKNLVGLYAGGDVNSTPPLPGAGTLTNNGDITAENDGTYGILSKGIDIVNNGTIKVGNNASTDSDAVGIYAENAKVTTDGDKIIMQGDGSSNKPIGIYAVSDNTLSSLKEITVNQGAGAMLVNGKQAIGVYLEDGSTTSDQLKLINDSDITLTDSAAQADKRIGIVLKKVRNTDNVTNRKIVVGKNNIGIYNENSILTHKGTLDVKHDEDGTQNIGIHNFANGDSFEFNVVKSASDPGLVDVEGRDGTVGISAATDGTNQGKINLTDAQIKVKASNMGSGKIPLGIYAKGDNLTITSTSAGTEFTVSPNAVGAYLEGNDTSKLSGSHKYNLSSENTQDRMAIGSYFKGGSYATTTSTEKVTVESTSTKANSDGAIRPIGLFYGENSTKNEANIDIVSTSDEVIGMYGKDLTFTNEGIIDVGAKSIGAYFKNSDVTNKGKINVTAADAYGLYLNDGNSSTEAEITASGKNSVGALITGNSGKFENKVGNKIISSADSSIGVYAKDGGEFTNSGTLTSEDTATPPNSIGAYADGAKLINAASGLIESKNVALYAKTSSNVTNSGTIDIKSGNGIVATDKTTVDLLAGDINSVDDKANGVIATDKTTINLSGTNITLTGEKSNAIYSDDDSTVNLTSGDVTVGKEGLGVYTNKGNVDLTAYTGTFTLGEKSVGIYSKASTVNGGTLKVAYTDPSQKGVGIYYDGGTVTNNTTVAHTGNNLVNILSKGADLTNTADQTVEEDSLGIYSDGGSVTNSGNITLNGDRSVGVYLDNGSKLNAIGTINGSTATNYKVGIYAKNGSIEGSGTYNFAIDNGVAMYLDDNAVNNFTGTLNMAGNSVSSKRAVGIYTTASITPRTINTNLNVTGTDAIGMFLSGDSTLGSTVDYGGTLDISSTSSNDYGIGAMVQNNSTFNLTSAGKVKIGGVNNIGFFVESGGTLQVTGGTVENTKEGIFAYLKDGKLDFKSGTVPNINFLNVFVSGSKGSIQNATAVTVGTKGLQANSGAKITNTSTGIINGTVDEAKALVGTGLSTIIDNQGAVKLSGEKSVAMYANDNATAISTGSVEVGKKSVAYYAKDNGLVNVSGTTKIDEDSTIFYLDKGRLNYTGSDITLPDRTTAVTIAGTTGTTLADFNGKNITVGENGTGVYVTGTAEVDNNTIQNLAKINVGKSGNGIYINNDKNFQSNIAMSLNGEDSIGVLSTKNGNIDYSAQMDSTTQKVKGLVHTGSGDTVNSGDIKLTGDSSIGAYAEGGNLLENTNKIEIAKGTTSATAVGLYGKNQTTVRNSGSIKMLESAIGIYGENSSIENTGSISNSGKNNNGIYGKDSNVMNSGSITLGDSSNGIYAASTTAKTITSSGDITVGNTEASGIFGAGKTGINTLGGTIKTGTNSVGLATEEGDITVGSATNFDVGTNSTYIYTEKGNAVNNANLALSDYSIGMYTKEGLIKNNANVTVGKSLVSSSDAKVSVGMAVEKGIVENFGNITVPDKWGVGMVANKGGTAINRAGATINVNGELSYGLQATDASTLINEGTINVAGKDSRGMAATNNSKVKNTGLINVNGENTQGIFVDFGSEVDNDGGTINVNNSKGTGILTGTGGVIKNSGTINVGVAGAVASKDDGSSQLQAGAIRIEKGGKAYIDNVEIQNSGTININGPLDLGTIKLGSTAGHIGTINAETFEKGKFMVLPNAALGTSKDMYTIQYLGGIKNVPNNGTITAISYSASFVADIQKDPVDHNKTRVVLVKIPYAKLLAETPAKEFGKGLDDLYKDLGKKDPKAPKSNKEQDMFDALRMISDKDELGATFDNELRGNVYANVQRRMLDINENFYNSYENLKNSNLYARGRFKAGAIIASGDAKDKNPGVINYKTRTNGLMLIGEKDFITYGRSANISLAFTETKFKFDYGSKERVHSGQIGVGFENYLTDKNWKYSTRGEFTLNRHHTTRKIHLNNGVYENKGKYWSETLEWKNKLRYETGSSGGLVTAGAFGTFNLGYGRFNNVRENGDGIELQIRSNNMYMVRPGVGVDLALNHYTKGGKVSLVGVATAEYELGKVYDGVNQARVRKSKAGYYDLEKPKKVRDIFKVGAQIQYETNAGHQIGVGVTREEGSVKATKFGVNAVYKF